LEAILVSFCAKFWELSQIQQHNVNLNGELICQFWCPVPYGITGIDDDDDMSFCALRNGHDTDILRLKWLMNWLMLYSVAANEGSDKKLRQNLLFLLKHIN